MANSPTIDFLRIFAAHRACCQNLLDLSRSQDRLIRDEDYTQLLVVLGKKQKVLNRMEEFSKHRPQIESLWKADRDNLDADLRQRCEDLLLQTENDLAELVRQEQHSSQEITQRHAATRNELLNIEQGGRVNEAYRDTLAPATHRRLDVGQ